MVAIIPIAIPAANNSRLAVSRDERMSYSEECGDAHRDNELSRVEPSGEPLQLGSRTTVEPTLNGTEKSHHGAWPLMSRALYFNEGRELPAVAFRIHFFDVGVLDALARCSNNVSASRGR